MPNLFLYDAADFVGGLPAEASAQAQGRPPFTLTLAPGAAPILIEIVDDDTAFDEIDGSQTISAAVTFAAGTFAAGTTINQAYDLINTTTGHKVSTFHFGGDGFQQGAVDGLVSTVELVPGTPYTFNLERTSHLQNNQYNEYVPCFCKGTLIETAKGLRAIECIEPGELVRIDTGLSPVSQVFKRSVGTDQLKQCIGLRPICIRKGALGFGFPERDLFLSPQHRVLVRSKISLRMFGELEVLIAAKKLLRLPNIERLHCEAEVDYFHLWLPKHSIVFAEGAPVESFYVGPMMGRYFSAGGPKQPIGLAEFVSEYANPVETARLIPSPNRARNLVERHLKNKQPVLQDRCFATQRCEVLRDDAIALN